MELFENKVGRLSNETLKKRKIFKVGVILGSIALILGAFCLGYHDILNLRGAVSTITITTTTKTLTKISLKRNKSTVITGESISCTTLKGAKVNINGVSPVAAKYSLTANTNGNITKKLITNMETLIINQCFFVKELYILYII